MNSPNFKLSTNFRYGRENNSGYSEIQPCMDAVNDHHAEAEAMTKQEAQSAPQGNVDKLEIRFA